MAFSAAAAARGLARYAPPVGWMLLILLLSGDTLASEATGSRLFPWLAWLLPWATPTALHAIHLVIRKLGHVTEYGILAALWRRALRPAGTSRAAGWRAFALTVGWAVLDELRQGQVASRTASALDVLWDALGAALALTWWSATGAAATIGIRLLRGAGLGVALGSLAAALVDWSLGLWMWDLVLAALGAALATVLLGRLGRR